VKLCFMSKNCGDDISPCPFNCMGQGLLEKYLKMTRKVVTVKRIRK